MAAYMIMMCISVSIYIYIYINCVLLYLAETVFNVTYVLGCCRKWWSWWEVWSIGATL